MELGPPIAEHNRSFGGFVRDATTDVAKSGLEGDGLHVVGMERK